MVNTLGFVGGQLDLLGTSIQFCHYIAKAAIDKM